MKQPIAWSRCAYCGLRHPELAVDAAARDSVVRALEGKSKSLAAVELASRVGCSQDSALACIDHWSACSRSIPLESDSSAALARVEQAFEDVPQPEHFTNYAHCDECADHDAVLRSKTRDTITRDDLGTMGWDPITFSTVEGKAYYLPALARYALLPNLWTDRDWYLPQLLWHLGYEGAGNALLQWCSPEQRAAIHRLLRQVEAARGDLLDQYGEREELASVIELWAGSECNQ